jgi:hypothetical protein
MWTESIPDAVTTDANHVLKDRIDSPHFRRASLDSRNSCCDGFPGRPITSFECSGSVKSTAAELMRVLMQTTQWTWWWR